ncbi:TPA: quorum-sensing peptide PapR [Bacillus toyonensis]|nr:quorum-sensing peptide PapR [Bacillus toyonensis]
MRKLLIGSLLTVAMLACISFGDTSVDQSQVAANHNEVEQLIPELPFEY